MPSFTCPNIAIPLSVRQMPPYTSPNVRQRQLEIADPRFGVGQAASMQAGRQAVFWHCQYSHTALMLCCRQAMLTISAIAQVEYQLPMPSRPAGSASMLNTTNEHCGQVTHSQIIFPDHFFFRCEAVDSTTRPSALGMSDPRCDWRELDWFKNKYWVYVINSFGLRLTPDERGTGGKGAKSWPTKSSVVRMSYLISLHPLLIENIAYMIIDRMVDLKDRMTPQELLTEMTIGYIFWLKNYCYCQNWPPPPNFGTLVDFTTKIDDKARKSTYFGVKNNFGEILTIWG